MPRENRKRGKKQNEDESQFYQEPEPEPEPQVEMREEPSWIVPATDNFGEIDPEATFGCIDADVKAYFRTVDIRIRDWQEAQEETAEGDGDVDPNEYMRLFFIAVLLETRGKEKQLATDPDCSVILERMSYSMDDFVRRVFLDTLAGSYEVLLRRRFASHVCQTLFTVARETISREMLLEVEADQDMANEPGSLMDRVMVGVITACKNNLSSEIEESYYLGTLLRDPNSLHLLEMIVSRCPDEAFNALWKTYFKGKFARLAAHPVTNFAMVKALERVSGSQVSEIYEELDNTLDKLIQSQFSARQVDHYQKFTFDFRVSDGAHTPQVVYSAFNITSPAEKVLLVPCVLTLIPLPVRYISSPSSFLLPPFTFPNPNFFLGFVSLTSPNTNRTTTPYSQTKQKTTKALRIRVRTTTTSRVLMQSILRLPGAYNQFVIDGLAGVRRNARIAHRRAEDETVAVAWGTGAGRSPTRISRKRSLNRWYPKNKHSQHRSTVNSSQNLNLYLLQRRPEDWKNVQSERKRTQEQQEKQQEKQNAVAPEVAAPQKQKPAAAVEDMPTESRKRKSRPENELDALFNEKLGKRIKKGLLTYDVV
ncbi:hypothetical protein CVT25_007347 [Psilocybe cyanescens]|uniref:Nucleolar protein 9 n=1 Tax=Psilocybe cyanescens TaxID=93625 RepID=A0A409XJD5_PSICY|nr:hypothetical protein CVT25_007347 [Psilocybe cyanescens]